MGVLRILSNMLNGRCVRSFESIPSRPFSQTSACSSSGITHYTVLFLRFKTVETFHSATNFCDRLKCIALGMLYAQFNEFYLNREKKKQTNEDDDEALDERRKGL